MAALRSSGDVPLVACSYLLTHLLLFGGVSLDVLAQGAGVGVALGAAGDLAGVGLLGMEQRDTVTPLCLCLPQPAHRVLSLGCSLSLLSLL